MNRYDFSAGSASRISFMRIAAVFVIILLIAVLVMPLAAAGGAYTAWAAGDLPLVVDNAGLLTAEENKMLSEYLAADCSERGFDIVVLTTNGTNGEDIVDYADKFYDANGYGYNDGKDGCLMIVDMESRQFVAITSGRGISALSDSRLEGIYDAFADNLDDGFYTAFKDAYAANVLYYVDRYDAAQSGAEPEGTSTGAKAGISAVIGGIIGAISSAVQKGKLKSVTQQTRAANYARRGSFVLTRENERFLYRNVIVSPRNRDNDSNHSTTHVSAGGGGMHGGGHAGGGPRHF